ncbi:hypothetical protein [Streptomyces sp. Amel2xC10]|uniref:hypothetical protein n=1 Tax=Streptomyces sp. Amel2xC10 TaxID=1305826 RepID=UPI000A083DD0|nr:hypothetical protein [Streptomyces sp. Amel2xC10]SMF15514.1 hypothetical protein SAMN02745830_01915 [Streptomyces sp. Amel2xC10]
MNRPGPALRWGLLGVTVTLVGYALFAAWFGLRLSHHYDALDRATATAPGVVVEDGIGTEDDIRVRWTDDEGRTHVQHFGVYDTDRYSEGARFPVRYAPGGTEGFPADPDETVDEDDLIAPVFLGALTALPLAGVWVWRGVRFLGTARRPGRPMTVRVHRGGRRTTWLGPTTWLELTAPDGTRLWQRVMGHPALAETPAATPVRVHQRSRRRAVVALPDGTRLVPLGRLRRHPAVWFLDEAVRADLRDAFLLPPGTVARPVPVWRYGVRTAAAGTALGALGGLALTGGSLTGTVGLALGGATLAASLWTLSAPQPS